MASFETKFSIGDRVHDKVTHSSARILGLMVIKGQMSNMITNHETLYTVRNKDETISIRNENELDGYRYIPTKV